MSAKPNGKTHCTIFLEQFLFEKDPKPYQALISASVLLISMNSRRQKINGLWIRDRQFASILTSYLHIGAVSYRRAQAMKLNEQEHMPATDAKVLPKRGLFDLAWH